MINGQGDLDQLLWTRFNGAIEHPNGVVGETLPVYFGVAEEEVVDSSTVPGLRFAFLTDFSLENQGRVRHQPRLYRLVDELDEMQGWQRIQPPTFRRLVYEVDLYTHKYSDMIELSQRVLSLLRREYGHLTDNDGNEIIYRLDGMTDMARKVEEERLFRRLFTFSFDAWVLEDDTAIGDPVKPITHINVGVNRMSDGQEMDSFWVPEDPAE